MNMYFQKALIRVITPFVISQTKYEHSGNVESILNVSYLGTRKHNKLDIHFPQNSTKQLPIVIYIHGGGWTIGDKSHSRGFCEKLADNGFLVFNVNYGLGPKHKHPEHIEHVITAINWIKENCKQYEGDINKIFLAGDSAGAHLASLVACICTNEKLEKSIGIRAPLEAEQIKGLILYYGAFNFETIVETDFPNIRETVRAYTGTSDLENYALNGQISPLHHVTEKFPPAFLTSGEVDPLHKTQTLGMIKQLEIKGIPHEKLLFDETRADGKHAFLIQSKTKSAQEALYASVNFLKKYSEEQK